MVHLCSCPLWRYVALYFIWGHLCERLAIWSRFSEPPHKCEHESLGVNQSGVKVLVAGLAKTGTRTISRSLYQLGLKNSYHSEDFALFVWANIADSFWLERGDGSWSKLPVPAFLGNMNGLDHEVLNGTRPEALAHAISKCKVDAIAFDGIERIFGPVYDVSPNAKVLLMHWRSFEQWETSLHAFIPKLLFEILFMSVLSSGMHVLPWGALVQAMDPLMGNEIEQLLRTGGPPICQEYSVFLSLFHGAVNLRRIVTRWFSGLQILPKEKEEYDRYHDEIKKRVPADRLLEWNMKKHRFEDLCKFLEMPSCPRSGPLPVAAASFSFQRDHPTTFAGTFAALVGLHVANVAVIAGVISIFSGKTTSRRSKAD